MPWPFVWRRRYEAERSKRLRAEAERDRAMETLARLKTETAAWERHTLLTGRPGRCRACGQYRARAGEHQCPVRGEPC